MNTALLFTLISIISNSPIEPRFGIPIFIDSPHYSSEYETSQHFLGEEVSGYPVWEERMVLYLTNKIRCDPKEASPQDLRDQIQVGQLLPLAYNYDLNRAARFFAEDMRDNGCFNADHSSCDGTPFEVRVSEFYSNYGAIGENIAMGAGSPEDVVDGWMHSPGHRMNILTAEFNELGCGFAQSHSRWWVQDFGMRENVILHGILNGVVFPRWGRNMGRFTFGVNFVDDQKRNPLDVQVAIEGNCYPLKRVMGTGPNGTYETELALTQGCREFYFVATDADAVQWSFPTEGSLLVSVGEECDFYTTSRKKAKCVTDDIKGKDSGCECSLHPSTHNKSNPGVGLIAIGFMGMGLLRGRKKQCKI